MRQRRRVVEFRVRTIHDVLIMAVVAGSRAVTAILEGRAALNPGRLRRLQRVKVRVVAVVDRSVGDRRGYK